MLKLNCTDEQMSQMAANAVNASQPMGMGFLHFQPGEDFKASNFPIQGDTLHLDYVQGRMVKFNAWKKEGVWQVRGNETDPEYQSWSRKYPTFTDLAKSAGATVEN